MSERQPWIRRLQLPPTELMVLASQVNLICSLEPGQFVLEDHLELLVKIIHNLAPKLSVGSSLQGSFFDDKNDSDSTILGRRVITDIGYTMPLNHGVDKSDSTLGRFDAIGIGMQVVEKTKEKGGTQNLIFTPVFDYGTTNLDPELVHEHRELAYEVQDFKPVKLVKKIPRPRVIYKFGFITYESVDVWSAKR